jgi:hypothetical protein
MNANLGVFQVEGQMLSERFDGSFAGVVSCIAGWIGYALLAARDDDSAGVAGPEAWDVGVEAVNDATKVGVQNLNKFVSDGMDCEAI